jgi:hypothetical protein
MALSEATTNKIKVLLYEGKHREAEAVLIEETGLSEESAQEYVKKMAATLDKSKQPEPSKTSKYTPYIFMAVSLAAWIAAVVVYINKQNKMENSIIISAQVIKFVVSDGGGFAPILKYEIDGTEYQVTSSMYSNPPAYEPNEIIEIYVSKDDPYDVMINSFTSKWLAIIILAFFGLVLDIIGVVALKLKTSARSNVDFLEKDYEINSDLDD